MINISHPENCCGCTACASICRHDAIEMRPDSLGFLYPHVDENKCVKCGLCDKVCSFKESYNNDNAYRRPYAYAARHKDIHQIEKSRSGAAFVALSDYILDHGGVVYGAAFDKHFLVVHKRANTPEERDLFRGSKYVQSDLSGILKQIRNDLASGVKVCFSGTPCQTAGLASFIGDKLKENLYLVDIVCHGVPSPYIWRDYVKYIERKYNDTVISVNFRDKTEFGWAAHQESFAFSSGKKIYTDSYKSLFFEHVMLRKSCANCHYCNYNRPSDITIGDFWGWERVSEDFNKDDKGCSLVLVNTEKGMKWLNYVLGELRLIPTHIDNTTQPNLRQPSTENPMRDTFEKDYVKRGFKYILLKYGNVGPMYYLRRIRTHIKCIITRIMNTLCELVY